MVFFFPLVFLPYEAEIKLTNEPLPKVFQYLEKTLNNAPKVFLNNLALSDKEGEIEIILKDRDSGKSSIIKDIENQLKIDKIIKIKTTTLDKYISSGKSKPTVVKLDVEGAESLVIDGGIEFFKNNNPIIAMEVWSKDNKGEFSMKAVKKLILLGYNLYFINSKGDLKKIDSDNLLDKIKGSFDNFIFLKI